MTSLAPNDFLDMILNSGLLPEKPALSTQLISCVLARSDHPQHDHLDDDRETSVARGLGANIRKLQRRPGYNSYSAITTLVKPTTIASAEAKDPMDLYYDNIEAYCEHIQYHFSKTTPQCFSDLNLRNKIFAIPTNLWPSSGYGRERLVSVLSAYSDQLKAKNVIVSELVMAGYSAICKKTSHLEFRLFHEIIRENSKQCRFIIVLMNSSANFAEFNGDEITSVEIELREALRRNVPVVVFAHGTYTSVLSDDARFVQRLPNGSTRMYLRLFSSMRIYETLADLKGQLHKTLPSLVAESEVYNRANQQINNFQTGLVQSVNNAVVSLDIQERFQPAPTEAISELLLSSHALRTFGSVNGKNSEWIYANSNCVEAIGDDVPIVIRAKCDAINGNKHGLRGLVIRDVLDTMPLKLSRRATIQ